MSTVLAEHEGAPRVCGAARFVPAAQIADVCAALSRARYLVAVAERTAPARGALGAAIDDAVEAALAMRGALPPCVEVDAALQEQIHDRMLRVHALDRVGLAVALPPLLPLADDRRQLDPADGAALVSWMGAARSAPILLVFDEADAALSVLTPVPLRALVGGANPRPEGANNLVDAPVATNEPAPGPMAEAHGEEAELPTAPETAAPIEQPPTPTSPVVVEPSGPSEHASAHTVEPVAESEPPPARVLRIASAAEWRALAVDLDAARGPKPVRDLCALYATRYVPLLGAVARGEVDVAVRGVVDGWRASFAHSYTESFAAVRVTAKRPPMVFDVPDLAARIGRQNGARMVKLLLVDSLSFDLGERVVARLSRTLAGRALCTERSIVWSALPTTTPTQLALLARGAEGLKDPPPSEREPDVARGRAVSMLRRDRVGSREIMKLDLVEARLRGPGPSYDDRLDAIAEEVEDVVARYAETLPARTLLALFGDHGFRLPASADGSATGPAVQGGASPEEVLVPASFWLIGGIH